MQDIHSIAAAVRVSNARNVARGGRKLPIRKAMTAVTGVSGFVLTMAIERNLWFAVPALTLLAATLVLQKKMTTRAETSIRGKDK